MASVLIDSVLHWKRKLERNPDDDYILSVIRKLSKVPITLEILETTHIGKTIRKLSKRDDTVGEKAKTVLKKWREIFTNQGSDKSKKFPSDSKKENVIIESSNKYLSPEKSIHFQKQISHKHEDNLLSLNLAAQPSKKYKNNSDNINNSTDSSHSLYKYDVKEMINLNYMDYDPHTESSEGYNPECPELFPTDKYMKTKKPVLLETYEPSSMKCPLPDETQPNEDKSRYKKLKFSNQPNSISSNVIELSERKDENSLSKKKNKDYSFALNKESTKKQEIASDLKKTNCKESSESERAKSKNTKVKIHSSEEFTSSEVSFEDCLGFNDFVSVKKGSKSFSSPKKQSSNSPYKEIPRENSQKNPQKTVSPDEKVKVSKDSSINTSKEKVSKKLHLKKPKVSNDSSHSTKEIPFAVPKPASKLNVADITSTLPEIQPNYRPLPRIPEFYAPKKKEALSNEEAIKFTSSRREKTAVYSGRKNCSYFTEVPTLFEICTRVLCENIDAIECVGDATYEIMKPVLEKCSPSQLYNIENYNPKFLENTNELWRIHCKRDYKLLSPMEHETWRELYWRAHDEREKKLKCVTANISALMSKSTPIRQVKLAYVDSHGYVKPPRDVARKQAKHGTAAPVNHAIKPNSSSKPAPKSIALTSSSTTTSSSSASSSALKKPKIAPLMAKTLKSLKAFRRK